MARADSATLVAEAIQLDLRPNLRLKILTMMVMSGSDTLYGSDTLNRESRAAFMSPVRQHRLLGLLFDD